MPLRTSALFKSFIIIYNSLSFENKYNCSWFLFYCFHVKDGSLHVIITTLELFSAIFFSDVFCWSEQIKSSENPTREALDMPPVLWGSHESACGDLSLGCAFVILGERGKKREDRLQRAKGEEIKAHGDVSCSLLKW